MRRALAVATCFIALSACGSEGEPSASEATTTTRRGPIELSAQVASYDLSTAGPQRVIVGLVASDNQLIAGGTIDLHFAHLGEARGPSAQGTIGPAYSSRFVPIPGASETVDGGPRLIRPSQGAGVYEATGVTFDKPGRWGALAKITIDGRETSAQGVLDVGAAPRIVGAGSPAPRTANPVGGASGVEPVSIDSRASNDEPIPDPELHQTSIADAIAQGRPAVVVVSTPVYCVSQFCGPITDEVSALAKATGKKAAFVHLEVWRDFEKKAVNVSAAEWIYPDRKGDLQEPWVFLIDRSGVVKARFDSVVGSDDLNAAVEQLIA